MVIEISSSQSPILIDLLGEVKTAIVYLLTLLHVCGMQYAGAAPGGKGGAEGLDHKRGHFLKLKRALQPI